MRNNVARLLAAAAVIVAPIGFSVGAATPASADDAHEGSAGCVNYKYFNGNFSDTVYYNAHCEVSQSLIILRDDSSREGCREKIEVVIGASEKGSKEVDCGTVTGVRLNN
ncbi:hypothetical protein [Nocardia sp. NPDC019395]|uniref:hypothetical protein n=1 Tax=Nocardia sp. NPDC019395 TaxID=3154686 RepID=UPI0033E8FD39